MHRTLKLTGDAAKISTPGKKQVYRIHTENGTKPEGDYITRFDEDPRDQSELFMFHPQFTYINKTVRNFTARPLLTRWSNNFYKKGLRLILRRR